MTPAHKTADPERVQPLNLGKPTAAPQAQQAADSEVDDQVRHLKEVLDTAEQMLAKQAARIAELERPKVPIPPEHKEAVLSMCLARFALLARCKVLAYRLKPGERVANADGAHAIVTVALPDDAGQLCFSFSEAQAELLAGIPNSSSYPIERRDLMTEDFETLVRAMLALVPEALKVADENPWRGQDSSPATHERLMRSV